MEQENNYALKWAMKRIMDLLLIIPLLLLFSPVFFLLFSMIFLEGLLTGDLGPLIIYEPRVSRGKIFNMYKLNIYRENFRKEYMQTSPEYKKLLTYAYLQQNPESIRFFGRLMKKFYFDELGQIFNILLNDMTLVGPRPLPAELPINKTPTRLLLKTALVGFTTNRVKNQGKTISKYANDEDYLDIFHNSGYLKLFITDCTAILDGILAVIRAKGL